MKARKWKCLASPGLDHEVACKVGRGCVFEGAEHDALVKRVTGDNGPVIEHTEAEGRALQRL